MAPTLRRTLKRRRAAALARARRDAGAPEFDPGAVADEVEACNRLLALLGPGPRERGLPVLVGAICVGVAAGLFAAPRSGARVVLEAKATAATLTLSAPWLARPGVGLVPPVRGAALSSVRSPGLFPAITSPTAEAGFEITTGVVSLAELDLQQGTRVTVAADPGGGHRLLFGGQPAAGTVLASGEARWEASAGPGGEPARGSRALLGPEAVEFAADGVGAEPAALALRTKDSWALRNLEVGSVALTREEWDEHGGVTFASTVLDATVTLPEVGDTHHAGAGSFVTLRGAAGRVAVLQLDEAVTLRFEGTAEDVRVGPPGAVASVRPRWLTYLYHQETLQFLWGAAAFLWGFLWSLRHTVFR